MNLKIENKFLNITNYPSVERYLESMAAQGWLITKIIVGSIFVFEKIKPQELDFSISPYEIETAFMRKSKEEIDEFESVCESIGWNYALRSYNLHVYYKEKGSEALAIHTDQEEEFNLIESIAKTQMKSYYFLIPLLIFSGWFMIGGLTSSIYGMKNGLNQIIVPLLPLQLILAMIHLVHTKKFLKTNRKNIELGKEIDYSDSKFYFTRINFALTFIIIILLVLHVIYTAMFLKDKITLFGFLPVLIGLTAGKLYRKFIKPSRYSKRYKQVGFILAIVVASLITIGISTIGIGGIRELVGGAKVPNRDKYKIILRSDFVAISEETEEGTFLANTSILIPRSYEYISGGPLKDEIRHIQTQYSKALTKNLAHELVSRYKQEAVRTIEGSYYPDLEYSYKSGNLEESLINRGLTQTDFDRLKEKELKEAIEESVEIIRERTIIQADQNLWEADEAYFLSNDKHEIVLRKGKEVFMLRGIDFTDPEVARITKEKIGGSDES